MVEREFWFVGYKVSDFADISSGFGSLVFSEVDLLRSEFFDEWIEGEEVDIFIVVVGSVHLLEFFWWFSGVDAFQDAELSEILEGEL